MCIYHAGIFACFTQEYIIVGHLDGSQVSLRLFILAQVMISGLEDPNPISSAELGVEPAYESLSPSLCPTPYHCTC